MRSAWLKGLNALSRNHGAVAVRFRGLPRSSGRVGNIRYFSDGAGDNEKLNTSNRENSGLTDIGNSNAADIGGDIENAATASGISFYPPDFLQYSIDSFSSFTGLPYWESIVAVTIIFRLLILPMGIKTARASAKMAIVKPDMEKISNAMKNDPNKNDPATINRYHQEMKALLKMHQVSPLSTLSLPLIQLPMFLSFFVGLKEMGSKYPGFSTGGDFWFLDLTAPDSLLILPIANAATFLLMLELGSAEVQTNDSTQMKNVLRMLGVAMVPLTMSICTGVQVYWVASNLISIVQSIVLKNQSVKKIFGIPDMPKHHPSIKLKNPLVKVMEVIARERARSDSAQAEIIDGFKPPPPPPPSMSSSPSVKLHDLPPKFKK